MNKLTTLPSLQLVTAIVCLCLALAYGCWTYVIKPPWQQNEKMHQTIKLLQYRLQQAKILLAQKNTLQQQWQTQQETQDTIPLTSIVSDLALQQRLFITELKQINDDQWQLNGTATFTQFAEFLQQLLRTPIEWSLSVIHLQPVNSPTAKQDQQQIEPVHDTLLQWQLTWQKTMPIQTLTQCTTTLDTANHDPFLSVSFEASQYPLAQIQWLGVMTTATDSAALIRLPNLQLQYIIPGDKLGREQWRLTTLNRGYADFIDSDNKPHHLVLDLLTDHGPGDV
jgi:hypothetical protein